VAARRPGWPRAPLPVSARLPGPDVQVEHGHEPPQFRSQATRADASMRTTIQATSTSAVRRFRVGRLR
jgi:hypothetical protein